jgi:hypothetical protein
VNMTASAISAPGARTTPSAPPRNFVLRLAGYAVLGALVYARRGQPSSEVPSRYAASEGFIEPRALAKKAAPAPSAPLQRASWFGLFRDAANGWMEHKDARLGAALAYYSVFSIGPLIVIAVRA